MTILKIIAGLAALLFVLIGFFAVIGGVLGFIQRARRGPTPRAEGLPPRSRPKERPDED
jgi:hypothetical protein